MKSIYPDALRRLIFLLSKIRYDEAKRKR